MSIDEACKAREQGASIKRLTWITVGWAHYQSLGNANAVTVHIFTTSHRFRMSSLASAEHLKLRVGDRVYLE